MAMVLTSILEALKFLLPALVFYFVVKMAVNAYLHNEKLKREEKARQGNREVTLPLRLQAYERLVLLLERIAPQQAVNRVLQPGMDAYEFQRQLTRNIREEYEHNTVQQVYVSSHAWAMIRTAKEEVIRLINTVSAEAGAKATASDFALSLIEKAAEWDINPIQAAIEELKKEAGGLF